MSALPPKADIRGSNRDVRLLPKVERRRPIRFLQCPICSTNGSATVRQACVARWNVCPARIKDVTRIAELGGSNVDDCLGVSRLYFCALRNVETSSHSDCDLKS